MSGAETPSDASIPVSATLSAYVAGVLAAEPSAEYRELGRLHVLDTLAAMVACRDLEPAVLARAYALGLSGGGGGPNAATILGTSDKASLVDAAFASAMTGHAAEINDFIPSAFVQPGPPVLAAALAVAETRG
ncbi:MAG: MmgE/PrpD family protein, partial [Phenylobacterium sp.]|nr:MmgE/PrpD family protein [Phenylobacterium sp.]